MTVLTTVDNGCIQEMNILLVVAVNTSVSVSVTCSIKNRLCCLLSKKMHF